MNGQDDLIRLLGDCEEFLQSVRLAEGLQPTAAPVGREGPPSSEAARFVSPHTLRHPVREAEHAPDQPEKRPLTIRTPINAMLGPTGVLPLHDTERVMRADGDKAPELGELIDLFSHRSTSFLARSSERREPYLTAERAARSGAGAHDAFTSIIRGSAGVPTPKPRRPALGAHSIALMFAGLYARSARSSKGLRNMLAHLLGTTVTLEQFVPRRVRVDEQDRSRLGAHDGYSHLGFRARSTLSGPAGHERLGPELMLGAFVCDSSTKVRLRIGPLSLPTFRDLLPGGAQHAKIFEAIRLYLGPAIEFDTQLVLQQEQAPAASLSRSQPSRLGLDTWLGRVDPDHEPDDVTLASSRIARHHHRATE